MLNSKNIDQYFMIIFAKSLSSIEKDFVFTNAAANTTIPPSFYSDFSKLNNLKWDLIDDKKWGGNYNQKEKQERMAELLILDSVLIEDIDYIIVWNEEIKKIVEKLLTKYNKNNKVIYEPLDNKHFYFTRFTENMPNTTLVTGPHERKNKYNDLYRRIINNRLKESSQFPFDNIENLIESIEKNFCCINELEEIYKMQTSNKMHCENVSDHTLSVVKKLKESKYILGLDQIDISIMLLSGYLHDIGKGPKSRWKNEIQPPCPEHPIDAIPMIENILTNYIKDITEYEIKKICLLVIYHDIVGDVVSNGRNPKELIDLSLDEKELNMLIELGIADVSTFNETWSININNNIPQFKESILNAKKRKQNDKISRG